MAVRTFALVGVLLATTTGLMAAERKVAREPRMGDMRPGERLLVDDGTCPAGQIKLVVGGNHVRVGGNAEIVRQRSCVSRRR